MVKTLGKDRVMEKRLTKLLPESYFPLIILCRTRGSTVHFFLTAKAFTPMNARKSA